MICPICSRDSDGRFKPFCSAHCAEVDLGRWMTGRYAIPSERPEDREAAEAALARKDAPEH